MPDAPESSGAAFSALWVAKLLQSSDTLYPTGSYAHSFGLEGLAETGVVRDKGTLRLFLLEQALPQLSRTDLPLAARAWEAAGTPPDWAVLKQLCQLGAAVRGTREQREASEAVGRQRCDLAGRLQGGVAAAFLEKARSEGWPTPACVAVGVEGRGLGAPREAVLAALVYSSTTAYVSAAIKLLRLGQNACQELISEALSRTPALVSAALRLKTEDIGAFNPWLDIASARHERADFRLFIS